MKNLIIISVAALQVFSSDSSSQNNLFDNKSIQPVSIQDNLTSDTIYPGIEIKKTDNIASHSQCPIVTCANGVTYTGTKKGIKMWDGFSNLWATDDNTNLPENNITALAIDKRDNLWIGTSSSGILIGVGNLFKPYKTRVLRTLELFIVSISTDVQGHMRVTYRSGGVEIFSAETSIAYFPPIG